VGQFSIRESCFETLSLLPVYEFFLVVSELAQIGPQYNPEFIKDASQAWS